MPKMPCYSACVFPRIRQARENKHRQTFRANLSHPQKPSNVFIYSGKQTLSQGTFLHPKTTVEKKGTKICRSAASVPPSCCKRSHKVRVWPLRLSATKNESPHILRLLSWTLKSRQHARSAPGCRNLIPRKPVEQCRGAERCWRDNHQADDPTGKDGPQQQQQRRPSLAIVNRATSRVSIVRPSPPCDLSYLFQVTHPNSMNKLACEVGKATLVAV